MKKVFCFGVLAICMISAFPVFAEDTVAREKTAEQTLDEIFVFATKTEEKRKDIPNSVLSIDHFDISESPALSLGEILGNEPGLDWRSLGDYGGAVESINIRGMSDNGTQVRVNGITLDSPSVGTADLSKVLFNNISTVEVVKGSGSVLFGSGAMGGTINLTTKRPEAEKVSFGASAGFGSQDAYGISAEQGMFMNENFGYYITARHQESDGFRDNSDLDHQDVSMNLVWEKGDILDVSLYADYLDRDYGVPNVEPPEGTRAFTVNGRTLYNDESSNLLSDGADRDAHVVMNLKSSPRDWLAVSLRTDYTRLENDFNNYWYSWAGTIDGLGSTTTNEVLGVEGNLEFTPITNGSLLVGGEYKDFDWKNQGNGLDANGNELPGTGTTAEENLYTSGLYSELQYRPCRYFKGIAGYRYEDHSAFGNEHLTRLAAIFNPTATTVIKSSHGKHFSAPTPNALFWPDDGFTRGNSDLEPETGYHSDITVEQSLLEDRVFLTASYFYWDLDNKIQWGPNSNGIWEPDNLKTFKADGLELGTRFRPSKNIALNFSYTYLDAEEENKAYTVQDYGWPPDFPPNFVYDWVKRKAAYTPENTFKAQATYWHESDLTLSAVVRYTDERSWYRTETDGSYPSTKTVSYILEDYWTVDLKAMKRFHEKWIFSIHANNILDEAYDTYFGTFTDQTSGITSVAGYPGAGASCFVSVGYEY